MIRRDSQFPNKLNCELSPATPEDLERAIEVHEKIFRRVLRFPDVTAVDVGYAVLEKQRRFLDLTAIRIHVKHKLSDFDLEKRGWPNLGSDKRYSPESIARDFSILGVEVGESDELGGRLCLDGVPLDIIEAKYHPSTWIHVDQPKHSLELEDSELQRISRSRVNTLVGGVSLSNSSGQAGTLGAVVWDRTDASPCILSNWHILAGSPSAEVGQPCFQPAIFDGGSSNHAVARLKRWCFDRQGDAALAEISSHRNYCSGEILGFWHPISGSMKPQLNMTVCKWGRTTGFTEGFIDGTRLATHIDYGNGLVRYFQDQFHVAPLYAGLEFSAGGDSGSLIVARYKPDGAPVVAAGDDSQSPDMQRSQNRVYYAVGLLFAGDVPGSQFGEYALATPVETLARELQFSFQPLFVPRSSIRPQLQNSSTPYGTLPKNPFGAWSSIHPHDPVPSGGSQQSGGPQPDGERLGPGNGGGTGNGG